MSRTTVLNRSARASIARDGGVQNYGRTLLKACCQVSGRKTRCAVVRDATDFLPNAQM